MTRFLVNLIRRPQIVQEVLNDTMMVVWSRPDSFHGASRLSTWIFAIACRKAMRTLRRTEDAVEDREATARVCPDVMASQALAPARSRSTG